MASRFPVPYSSSRNWMQDPLFQLQREIDRVFEDVFGGGASAGRSGAGATMNAPRIDLQEVEGELRLHADLPGIQPSDLDVRVDGDVLTIRGERKHESDRNEQNFHVMERSHGRFQRSIQLPFAPDPEQVQAEVRHGVLEIRIPKRAPEQRSRRIEVRGGEAQSGGGRAGGGAAMTQAVGGSGAGASGGVGLEGRGDATSPARSETGSVAGGPTSVPVGEGAATAATSSSSR